MTYILLVAGKGTRLHPITLHTPKSLFRLDNDTTVIQRMIRLINQYDAGAKIAIVTGFMHEAIEIQVAKAPGVIIVTNPFYSITNSIASLWFAREYLNEGDITIINGDIVVSDTLFLDCVKTPVKAPTVLLDSSIRKDGDYNVQVNGNKVVVMSKELKEYYGEYAGIVKLDHISAGTVRQKIVNMINAGGFNHWYEDALVQLIFEAGFELAYTDISSYSWTEIDDVDDLLFAKKIHLDKTGK